MRCIADVITSMRHYIFRWAGRTAPLFRHAPNRFCHSSADAAFEPSPERLQQALSLLLAPPQTVDMTKIPSCLPDSGIGDHRALEELAPVILGGAQPLGADTSFAHMDPPTPCIAWATTLWNASLNQNLLHPDVAPVARGLEEKVVSWLAPFFGMDGGHMTPGSTVANLTAIWAARELTGAKEVVASEGAHLSVPKAAHLLGMRYVKVPLDECGRLDASSMPQDLSQAVLVLTAGTTSAGAIDPLSLCSRAAWTHVDAAWAGPMIFSPRHGKLLHGISQADSVSVSAHKWLFQPKESGLIFFRDTSSAHKAVSFGGAYLAVPNVGVLGSHGAVAAPLMATLMSWGKDGLAKRIDRCMDNADHLWQLLNDHPKVRIFGPQETGVILWQPSVPLSVAEIKAALPAGSVSMTSVAGRDWLRHVAANPNVDVKKLWSSIKDVLNAGS